MNELIEKIEKILNGNNPISRREIFQILKDCKDNLTNQEMEINDLMEENAEQLHDFLEQAEELEKLKTKGNETLESRCKSLLKFLSNALPEYNHLINVEYTDSNEWVGDGKPYTWQIEEITEDVIALIDSARGLIACIVKIEGIDQYYYSTGKHINLTDYIILNKEYYGLKYSIFKRI